MALQTESAAEKNQSQRAEMTTDNPPTPRAAGQASDSHPEEVTSAIGRTDDVQRNAARSRRQGGAVCLTRSLSRSAEVGRIKRLAASVWP